jgi:hypothetical protein
MFKKSLKMAWVLAAASVFGLLSGSAQASILVLDNPVATPWEAGAAGTLTQSFTVSSGASVLVVGVSNKSGSAPATITWNGLTITKAVDKACDGTVRDVAFYYIYNPLATFGNATTTGSIVGTFGGPYTANAFTLQGVDTSVAALTGSAFTTGSHNPVSATINVPTTGAWANPGGAWAVAEECTNLDTTVNQANKNTGFTFTGSSGTSQALWFAKHGGDTNVNTGTGVGLVEGLTTGSNTITGTILPIGGDNYVRSAMATVVFAPALPEPASLSLLALGGLALIRRRK